MKKMLSFLLVACLSGCGSAGPGQALNQTKWVWTPDGAPTPQLKAALDKIHSPVEISQFLRDNITFSENYDVSHFLSPNELMQMRQGDCTAYARFWLTALEHLDMKGQFLAVWGPTDSHAVTIFKGEQGRYRLASNDRYFSGLDLDPENKGLDVASMNAAEAVYGENWKTILFFDDNGRITKRLDAVAGTGVTSLPFFR